MNYAACNGEEWVELFNNDQSEIDLTGYSLADDKGFTDVVGGAKPYTFNAVTISAGQHLVVCRMSHFLFKIGGGDTVTLRNNMGTTIDSSGMMPDTDSADNVRFPRWHAPTPRARTSTSVP